MTIPASVAAPWSALVSGGNRGLGLEVVRILLDRAPDGATIFLGSRDLAAGTKQAAALEREYSVLQDGGKSIVVVRLDVTDAASIASAAETASATVAHLDLLVNNAGIMPEADEPAFGIAAARRSMATNFAGVVAVTTAFLPLLLKAPENSAAILSVSSGVGARTMGLLSPADREAVSAPSLDDAALAERFSSLLEAIGSDPVHPYHSIPTVGYGLSKAAVNCYTRLLAVRHPTLRVNACSPGFTNTGMCKNYTGTRVPKEVELGASVVAKVLFGELGAGRTGTFFKEASKPGTAVEEATSVVSSWVQ